MAKKVRKQTPKSKLESLQADAEDEIVIGVDVHKRSYHVGIRKNGLEATHWVMPRDDDAFVELLEPVRPALRMVVYEAGPTGYGLARKLEAAGIPVGVVAPGKTPQPVNEDNKSDRLDCRRLAEYADKRLLKYVAIPTEEEEAERAVMRQRDALKKEIARTKARIRSCLLCHGLPEPEKLWSKTAVAELRDLALPEDLRVVLDSLLRTLDFAIEERRRLDRHLATIEKRHEEEAEILRSHPGVGAQTTRHMLTELFRPERFANKRQVVSYVGLAPRVRRSGEGCKKGGRLPAGRKALRDCLTEASWQWVNRDDAARELYRRLLGNTGEANKAITGVTRHLLINLWTMLIRREHYRPPPSAAVGAAPTSS